MYFWSLVKLINIGLTQIVPARHGAEDSTTGAITPLDQFCVSLTIVKEEFQYHVYEELLCFMIQVE